MEFSKNERKKLRLFIERGLQREYAAGLEKAAAVMDDWRKKAPSDHREHYLELFKTVHNHDKHIARRYDRLSGSNYGLTVLGLLQEGVLTEEDLEGLSEETLAKFRFVLGRG